MMKRMKIPMLCFCIIPGLAMGDTCTLEHREQGLAASSELILAQLHSVKRTKSDVGAMPAFNEAKFETIKIYQRSGPGEKMKFKHQIGGTVTANVRDENLGGIHLVEGSFYVLALTLPDMEFDSASVDGCDGSFLALDKEDADKKVKAILSK